MVFSWSLVSREFTNGKPSPRFAPVTNATGYVRTGPSVGILSYMCIYTYWAKRLHRCIGHRAVILKGLAGRVACASRGQILPSPRTPFERPARASARVSASAVRASLRRTPTGADLQRLTAPEPSPHV